MKCPKCGNNSLKVKRLRFVQYVNLVEAKCHSCEYRKSYVEIAADKTGEVFLRLLRRLLDAGNLNKLLSESDRKRFNYILRKLEKKLEEEGLEPFEISEPSESDAEILLRMKAELLERYQTKIYNGESGKSLLEEIKIIDTNIQSAKQQANQSESEQKVFLFEYDGEEHTGEFEEK